MFDETVGGGKTAGYKSKPRLNQAPVDSCRGSDFWATSASNLLQGRLLLSQMRKNGGLRLSAPEDLYDLFRLTTARLKMTILVADAATALPAVSTIIQSQSIHGIVG